MALREDFDPRSLIVGYSSEPSSCPGPIGWLIDLKWPTAYFNIFRASFFDVLNFAFNLMTVAAVKDDPYLFRIALFAVTFNLIIPTKIFFDPDFTIQHILEGIDPRRLPKE